MKLTSDVPISLILIPPGSEPVLSRTNQLLEYRPFLKSCSKGMCHDSLVYFVYNANYVSLFAEEFETLLVTGKIVAPCQTNISPRHYFKCYKQQKRTLKTCYLNKFL